MAEALDPILPGRIDTLAKRVLREASMRGLTLAAAESCTGGLLASLLTDVPGSSHVFERGFVTYSNEAKAELLGLSKALLDDPGPVSDAAARAMAQGALIRSRADLALSVTGWTESDPSAPENPAGRVFIGCARRSRETAVRHLELGDIGRAAIRIACLEASLEMAIKALGG